MRSWRPMRCIRTRGKKGVPHRDPDDRPRRRANKHHGHGTWDNDRPPVWGLIGRQSGRVRLQLVHRSTRAALAGPIIEQTRPGTLVNTDEWRAYRRLPQSGRPHQSVSHNRDKGRNPEWARDDDSDGIREVHCNTIEGLWTGVRNFLRPFRGISKTFLSGYLSIFEWGYNLKTATTEFLRALLGVTPGTVDGT